MSMLPSNCIVSLKADFNGKNAPSANDIKVGLLNYFEKTADEVCVLQTADLGGDRFTATATKVLLTACPALTHLNITGLKLKIAATTKLLQDCPSLRSLQFDCLAAPTGLSGIDKTVSLKRVAPFLICVL